MQIHGVNAKHRKTCASESSLTCRFPLQFHDGVYLIFLLGLLEGFFVPLYQFYITPSSKEQKVGTFVTLNGVCVTNRWSNYNQNNGFSVSSMQVWQGWCSGESTRLPPMCHRFDCTLVQYVGWVCCWFSPCCDGFFLDSPVFFPEQKTFQIPIRPG